MIGALRRKFIKIRSKMQSLQIRTLFANLRRSETMLHIGVALIVGLASGAGVWLFKYLIELFHKLSFESLGPALSSVSPWMIALVPAVGGILVGLISHYLVGQERHHGVAGIMEAVALAGGRLRYGRIPAKAAASALSIGSGASVGPEDPSVQIGANIGSMFGQWLHLSDDRMRSLVAAGAASGIAAAFNAPIAGVFFALEIILGEITSNSMGVIVLASVISAVFTQATSGAQPAFAVPSYALNSAWELLFYLGLGLLAGPVSALYIRLLYRIHDLYDNLRTLPRWLQTGLTGLLVGGVGIFLPQIYGVGYETIEAVLNNHSPGIFLLLVLMIAKLVLTPVSLAGGFMGGVFAPSLFIGAMLGGAFGESAAMLFPGLGIDPPAFAMVGMAAVLAGAVHTPLTAIILLFEMTNDYHIILPLMFSVVVSLLISQRLQGDSVYTLSLLRKGIRLDRGRDLEILETLTAGEIMHPTETLPAAATLAEAAEFFQRSRHHGAPVLDENGHLLGVFTIQDLEKSDPSDWKNRTILEACSRHPIIAFPDETAGAVLDRMGNYDVGRIPVVSREDPQHLIGLVRRADLVRAYSLALNRRAVIRHKAHQIRLDATTHTEVRVHEVQIQPGASCENKRIREITWPQDCILSTLRRGRRVFIPHGDTVLRAGDVLVAVVEGDAGSQLEQICSPQADT